MMRILATLAALAAMTVLADPGRAQCTPIPNTGCPNATAPTCGGTTQIGGVLTLSCINNGRASISFTLVGNVAVGITQIAGVTCFNQQCGIAVDLVGVVALQTNFQQLGVQIPNDPTLIGKSIAVQCFDLLPPTLCVWASQGLQVTFTQ